MTSDQFSLIRANLGLSQARLAAVMGYKGGQPAISTIENGAGSVPAQAARLLLAYEAGYRPDDWPRARTVPGNVAAL